MLALSRSNPATTAKPSFLSISATSLASFLGFSRRGAFWYSEFPNTSATRFVCASEGAADKKLSKIKIASERNIRPRMLGTMIISAAYGTSEEAATRPICCRGSRE